MKQFIITPACGKRLIGKALAVHPAMLDSLKSGTVVIVAGTTNGYVAEEILMRIDQAEGFARRRFFRGITLPSSRPTTETGRLPDENSFPGDVIIVNGLWQKGKTIFDVINDLKEGDIILKGANALDLSRRQAAICIGHPKAGTIGATLQAVTGRRVRLILPVGLEKRSFGDLTDLAIRLNMPGAQGPRLLPVPGRVFTEIDAISLLTSATAELVASGGVCGAEGCCWLAVSGTLEQMQAAEKLLKSVSSEPPFAL
ncbi:MAG: hypothetical protein U9R02_00580 [Thermodesulfobacteriota bacterium]|nr:hypothetical protein [Thermodesulfobacteriota bacterium]